MRTAFSLLLLLLLVGCASLKTKTKTDTISKEVGSVVSTRKGDTLFYTIPKVTYKDTTILIKNKQKDNSNTLKISYDKQGNEESIECISDEINELKEYIKDIRESKKVKESMFQPIFILYIFLGLTFLIFFSRIMKKFGI